MDNLIDREHIRLEWPDIIGSSVCDESDVIKEYFADKLASGKPGFAIDFGAADGICHNNCFELFNTPFCWRGISVDANPRFHEQRSNLFSGTNVRVCFDAVGVRNEFVRFQQNNHHVGLSSIKAKGNIEVYCLNINTFLEKYNVPSDIDFVSMDLEGVEKSILQEWDFTRWKPKLFCIERGNKFKEVLTSKGYKVYNANGGNAGKYKICHGNTFFYLKGTWPQPIN